MQIKAGQVWRSKYCDSKIEVKSYTKDTVVILWLLSLNEQAVSVDIFLEEFVFVRNQGEASKIGKQLADAVSQFDSKIDVGIKAGQIWKDKDGVMFRLVEVYNSDIHGLGACDIVSIDRETSKYIGLGELTRNYTLVFNKGEIVKDKNNMQKESTGIKADSDKRRYSLLPKGTVNEVVDVLEFGSRKYCDNNWQKVDNARTRYYDACLRHIDAWFNGEIKDSETDKHHLAHAICCLMFLMWFDMERVHD